MIGQENGRDGRYTTKAQNADRMITSLGAMYLGHLPWWPGTPAGTTRPGLRLGRMKFRIARPRSHSMTNRSVKTFWSLGAIAIVS